MDCAQLVPFLGGFDIRVEHGWQPVAGPFVVSRAKANRVMSLDFRPAGRQYLDLVARTSGQVFGGDDFFSYAKAYPLGMVRPDNTFVIRDPIAIDGDSLICVGEVPDNSIVYLMHGQAQTLLDAAQVASAGLERASWVLAADCISRALFLGEGFALELAAIQRGCGAKPVFGMLTLGEIANRGDASLEFLNKTLVLAAR